MDKIQLVFEDEITKDTLKYVRSVLSSNPKAKECELVIYGCIGGDVYATEMIMNDLVISKMKLTALVKGFAFSAASVLLMVVDKKDRVGVRTSKYMIHQAIQNIEGGINKSDAQEIHEVLTKVDETLWGYYQAGGVEKSDRTMDLYNNDKVINAEEAKEIGLIGEIVDPAQVKAIGYLNINNMSNSTIDALKKRFNLTNKNAGGPVNKTSSLEDGTPIYHDGDLAEGVAIFTDDAMTAPLDDGNYTTTDGVTFVVSGGAGIVEMIVTTENSAEFIKTLMNQASELVKTVAKLESEKADITNQYNEIVGVAEAAADKLEDQEKQIKNLSKSTVKSPIQNFAKTTQKAKTDPARVGLSAKAKEYLNIKK